ncbi:hypothetical protein WN51_05204 [Melipona quadrifasciata]|uniref:Uncharacterized protein n=1 Tax=Melipona quadrifasciata TaxID=166423 RepID=A0A0N0BDC2_9HYME|nr:hypothetical protein WN51_05204 [Melipona quadrifasciata]
MHWGIDAENPKDLVGLNVQINQDRGRGRWMAKSGAAGGYSAEQPDQGGGGSSDWLLISRASLTPRFAAECPTASDDGTRGARQDRPRNEHGPRSWVYRATLSMNLLLPILYLPLSTRHSRSIAANYSSDLNGQAERQQKANFYFTAADTATRIAILSLSNAMPTFLASLLSAFIADRNFHALRGLMRGWSTISFPSLFMVDPV